MRIRTAVQAMILVTAALMVAGCLEQRDYLKVNKNGSGLYMSRIVLGAQLQAMVAQAEAAASAPEAQAQMQMEGPLEYALSEEGMNSMLEEIAGVELAKWRKSTDKEGRPVYQYSVTFDSLEALLSSPLGEDIGWSFEKEGDQLVAYLPENWMDADAEGGNSQMNMDDPQAFNMIKSMMAGLKVERRIELPNPATSSNTERRKGNVLSWVVEITPETKQEELMNAPVPRATCSAQGIAFALPMKPVTKASEAEEAKAELEELSIPADQPLSGVLCDRECTLHHAAVRNGILTLSEQDHGQGDSLIIFLFLDEGEAVAGRSYLVAGESKNGTPHVHVHWEADDDRDKAVKSFTRDYTMKLEFAEANDDGTVPGTIHLEKELGGKQIRMSGAFTATVK